MKTIDINRDVLTQEQIAQMLEEGVLDFSTPEVVINDFLFKKRIHLQYQEALNHLFTDFFSKNCFQNDSESKNENILETYYFFLLICRNRELLIQIATDKGILFNPKKQS